MRYLAGRDQQAGKAAVDRSARFAFIGKGGVGKTILSTLAGRLFLEAGKKVLFIDADPAMGLATSLQAEGYRTIGQAREEIIQEARGAASVAEKAQLSDIIDYLLLETLFEASGYSLIVMGQTDTLGCYCPVNRLLRSTIGAIAAHFDAIIIDAEAGIEQVNRQVVEHVHYPLLVTDNSLKGVKTAIMIDDRIRRIPTMAPVKTGVIFNRVEAADPFHVGQIITSGMHFYGSIPADNEILEFDRQGRTLLEIPSQSKALKALRNLFVEAQLLKAP